MSKYYPPGFRPQIIVNKFQDKVYDVRHRGVHHPEFPSVLTALEIDDAVVANCLIDIRSIETVLLIKVRLPAPYWPLKKGIVSCMRHIKYLL